MFLTDFTKPKLIALEALQREMQSIIKSIGNVIVVKLKKN